MFLLNEDLSIYGTRGDIMFFGVSAYDDGEQYEFQAGDVVRFKVYAKKAADNVVLQKDFPVTEATKTVEIFLSEDDTKFGEVISKPTDYWYEVELNPGENPQTIIGYDEEGAKVFKLYPEGADIPPYNPITPEDIPVVDDELDLTSTRPVENRSIARAIVSLQADVNDIVAMKNRSDMKVVTKIEGNTLDATGCGVIWLDTNESNNIVAILDAYEYGLCKELVVLCDGKTTFKHSDELKMKSGGDVTPSDLEAVRFIGFYSDGIKWIQV